MNFKTLNEKLNDFPHIQQKLKLIWGTKGCRDYLKSLLIADRLERQGFPNDLIIVLTKLVTLHDALFPQHIPKTDIWDDVK